SRRGSTTRPSAGNPHHKPHNVTTVSLDLKSSVTEHDLLVMPSTTLEAMGLVALEAQACGLPVLYQPVPGLSETLAASGMATDFTSPAALARDLDRLRTTPGLLPALRRAGHANAARYPLSATAQALTDLGRQLT
ncbi:glycosyltransferase, partial [Streptomyces sp. NPDC007000]|uniref:glycosyltransferase n=1 Tax=Streptomyces sp. NPDC007000 TaxID=3155357 RepID=UPI0033F43168